MSNIILNNPHILVFIPLWNLFSLCLGWIQWHLTNRIQLRYWMLLLWLPYKRFMTYICWKMLSFLLGWRSSKIFTVERSLKQGTVRNWTLPKTTAWTWKHNLLQLTLWMSAQTLGPHLHCSLERGYKERIQKSTV